MKRNFLGLLAVLFFMYSCNNAAENTAGNVDTVPLTGNKKLSQLTEAEKDILVQKYLWLENAISRDSSEKDAGRVGQEVDIKLARACIKEYEKTMKRHGIDSNERREINLGTITSQKITWHEEFSGAELLDWMTKMVSELSVYEKEEDKGKDVSFEMHMGIYTKEFLDQYVEGEDKQGKLRDRITIFIIPRGNAAKEAEAEAANTRKAYELGNLQP
jgi:hypothetical protein